MSKPEFKIAVVGATGLVGRELLQLLAARRFPVAEARFYASLNSAGDEVEFRGEEFDVEAVSGEFYQGLDIIFFAAHHLVSRDLAEQAAGSGAVVIDSSRTFRLAPDVALCVPEINPGVLAGVRQGKRMVASPSPATVALALVLAPLNQRFGIRRVSAATLHGSATAGRASFEEHQFQTINIFNQEALSIERFPRQSAFNIFPRVGQFDEGGMSEAEADVVRELPRVLGAEFPVAVTAAQVPIFCGIAAAVDIAFDNEADAEEVKLALAGAAGVKLMDDSGEETYPDTLLAMEHDEILVGRIRPGAGDAKSVQLWISADNLRKGGALNMVQIAEEIIKDWP
ncbi:MAG TPA: aspartate-semialdehyde dehydrogenase [bacterium]|nr:aspartate-semialdehyde dehydrogenase [bacterium]